MRPTRLSLLIAFALVGIASQATAQVNLTFVGPGTVGQGASSTGGNGVQLGERTILHAGVGSEAGYDTNVYYADSTRGPQGAGILRILPFVELTNRSRGGEIPGGVFFDARASLLYREYLSDRVDEENKRAFMPSLGASVELSSGQKMSLALSDAFTRTEDPPYISGAPIIRNGNQATAQARFSPGGGRLQGMLRYTNAIDLFGQSNTSYRFADSMSHEATLDVSWRWLPKTALFVQLKQGYVQYFHDDGRKYPSYPLHASIGLRGLVTEKVAVGLGLGYANAFYSSGASTGGFLGSGYAGVDVAYRPTITTNVGLGYRHDFQNSVISNFYYVDAIYAGLQQLIAGRVTISATARWEHRNFQGLVATAGNSMTRVDDFFQVAATADYSIKSLVYVGAGYALMNNRSSQQDPTVPSDYLKHQILGRLGINY